MKIKTYAGIPEEFAKLESAKVVLIPVPYEGTGASQSGASKGPEAFLEASENMGLYDIETATEVYKQGIFLADAVKENSSTEAMVKAVHEITKKYIKRNKFVTIFGGEHSVSIGTIRAFNETFNNLTVLHLDAHANLNKTHKGSSFNSACAAYEASQTTNLIQVGIRSMDVMEKTFMDEEKTYFAHEMAVDDTWMDSAIDQMTDNVFITFDVSALDISIMPNSGNPQPGGLFWYETLDFLKQVFAEKNVVGFDIMEFCPNEHNKASDALVARLYNKMLSYKFQDEDAGDSYDNSFDNSFVNKSSNSKFEEDDDY
ncbi:agmatinase [Confluentibacter flavum]|uniref:Agmatinase n=1 Tax=Confluentibacter flavum TaxID=1909700 RepID=A0A2N3HFJ4_9FLAO|nr:agmatinase [Confluentibacter flavum]PKQ43673.1 agmatinase [Confluentibacter flavum]